MKPLYLPLSTKLEIRFEGGEYFGPFLVDAICTHYPDDESKKEYTYSLVKLGEVQPSFWFDSDEIV